MISPIEQIVFGLLILTGGVLLIPECLKAQSQVPEHIILTWEDDPMTTQSVTWRTEKKVPDPVAQIMKSTAAPYGEGHAKTLPAKVQSVENEGAKAYYYSVTFTGLDRGTKYLYRVGSEESDWSAWTQFSTASKSEDDFSFIYLGDIQNDIFSWGSRAIRAAYDHAPDAAFALFAGDCVNDGHSNDQWMEWFDASGYRTSMMPIVPVTGNHEYDHLPGLDESTLSVYWQKQFELPSNGPRGLEESVFYMDYKDMRLVVLNSTAALSSAQEMQRQSHWLQSVLADHSQKWTIVTFHHALFTARDGNHGDYPDLRAAWQPILEKHKVDLVLMGHDHVYARASKQTKTITVPEGEAGPVYLVSVAGPKMYGVVPERRWMDRAAVNTQMYQTVTIRGDLLEFRAYTVVDELYDSFDLKKQPGAFNKFVENISSKTTPENRFPDGKSVRSKK
ncbi:metallophosphoesterase family protein [Membranicola marinus]|uniref:Metallophosphoesterase family protein n=1 Tax=Membranihabitans marinus TaxID=1227546 RepID=A0A953L7V9_9BACT|nr:metallophosphoesterase family protein [Membranihabitans marinus]MBY5959127.1 metallophosphoesterase family protein [Membranihabitans marinus]